MIYIKDKTLPLGKVLSFMHVDTVKVDFANGGVCNKKRIQRLLNPFGTQTRGRTGMDVNPLVFETSASTDSAIWANGLLLVCGCKGR